MVTMLPSLVIFLFSLIGPSYTYDYGRCLQQSSQIKQRNLCNTSGPLSFSSSCKRSGLDSASLLDWSSMQSAHKVMQDCGMPAARLACDANECAVIVVSKESMGIANIISGIPKDLCKGLVELCQTNAIESNADTLAKANTTMTGCPVSPSVCVSQNATAAGQFVVLQNVTLPFGQAKEACSRMGMSLADVTISNFLSAVDTILHCLGPRQKAWVSSWNGDSYGNDTCLALTVGDSSGGGAINPAANCASPLPVLCQNRTQTVAKTLQCSSDNYEIVYGVDARSAVQACRSMNMTLAKIDSDEAVSEWIQRCPNVGNQTMYVDSYKQSDGRTLCAEECGCLGVAMVSAGSKTATATRARKLVAIRPLFECQCAERRAALCIRPWSEPSATMTNPMTGKAVRTNVVLPSVYGATNV